MGQRPGNEPTDCPQPCKGGPSRQSRQKTPAIVYDQGSSQISPRHPASRPGTSPSVSIRAHLRSNSLPSPSPESVSHFPPIKAKTPVIVHNQGISRHRPKNTRPLGASLEHSDWNWELPHPTPFAPLQLRAYAFPPASSLNQGKKPSHRA